MSTGFTLSVFLPDGDPEGLRLVSRSHWTGQALMTRRNRLEQDIRRPELGRSGVYILHGPGQDDPSTSRVYVGEGDVVADRIRQHSDKEFWTEVVVFTKTDESLNKAHIRHLEARLVARAKEAGRAEIDNVQLPSPPAPTESEGADVAAFLEDVLVVLRLLGINAFDPLDPGPEAPAAALETFELTIAGTGGLGRRVRDGFLVLQGSRARATETDSLNASYRAFREGLKTTGALVPEGDALVFTQDVLFATSSAAGVAVYGGHISGPQSWKRVGDGKTLKELEDEALAVDPVPAGA